uniref:Chromosome 18 open reading frame 21 n=1 Tax=Pelusios castaneus TaxID=367368 RepID=A0A8C8VEU2_9SAUR
MSRRRWFLETAARGLMGTCPAQARFLMWTLQSRKDDKTEQQRICPYCFQFLVPDNHRVRLKPKMKVTPWIQKLLNREAKNHKLNLKQTKLLKKYKDSGSVLLVTCKTCNKTTRHYGKSRDFLATAATCSGTPKSKSDPNTPISANKMTPLNHSKSGSKGSPASTSSICRSGQSTPSSFSKTPKKPKFHFSQLKWLLNHEEKQKSQNMDLKNFLFSL